MLLQEGEKGGARADRGDEGGEVQEGEVGVGEGADFVEQFGTEAIEKFAAIETGGRLRRTARQ